MSAAAIAQEAARLSTVADYVAVRPDARADLQALCELATVVCDVPFAAVNLIDDRTQHQIAAFGIDPTVCSRSDSLCTVAVAGGRDVHVPDAREDARFVTNPWVDGRLGQVRLYSSAVLRSPAGHAVGTLCVFDEQPGDLSDRRRSALRLLAAQAVDVLELQLRTAELARSQEALAAFAGQLSHDLKTPLTATVGFTELLAERPAVRTDETASGYARRCLNSARRMLATIDQLLAYSRVGGTLRPRPVPLDEVMPAVLEDLGALPPEVDVSWRGDTPVPADPAQLRALLQNLVGNAVKYRPAGRPLVVEIESTSADGGVELVVRDDGAGIPADQRTEALAPLRRLRTDVPGSGLGLATCRRVLAAHGGTLQLGDTVGGGLTVRAVFPTPG